MELRHVTAEGNARAVESITAIYRAPFKADMRHEHTYKDGTVALRGRLLPESSRQNGARRSWSGRRVKAACWHAHRDYLRALFAECPDAVIVTALARYTADTFEDVYPSTANRNVGSMLQPAYMDELCECDQS